MSGAEVVWAARRGGYMGYIVWRRSDRFLLCWGVSCWLLLCRGIVAGAMVSGAEMLLSVRARLTCWGMWCWGLL